MDIAFPYTYFPLETSDPNNILIYPLKVTHRETRVRNASFSIKYVTIVNTFSSEEDAIFCGSKPWKRSTINQGQDLLLVRNIACAFRVGEFIVWNIRIHIYVAY